MGMDLYGNWKKGTPQNISNEGDPHLHYNWTGWRFLQEFLETNGVDIEEFSGSNDGDLISRKTCKAVAECIEKNINQLAKTNQVWLWPHIKYWKWIRNYRQY